MTTIIVSSGNTFVSFPLSSGDTMRVLSGGVSAETTVSSGGLLLISSGGASHNDTVLAGGREVLSSGAAGSGLTVSSGGTLAGAGLLSGATTDFGLVSGVSIVSGTGGFGSMTVGSHGVASGVTVNDAFAFIQSGGTARNLQAVGGALVVVSAGGTTTGTVFGPAGGAEDVSGIVHGTILSHGAAEIIFSGGLAVGTIVSSSANQIASSGGLASGAVILNGGTQLVEVGGKAKGTILANGGSEQALSGGVALSSFIGSGGNEFVMSGGLASAFAVSGGGDLTVSSGGVLRVGATGTSTNFGSIEVQSTAEMDLAGTLQNGGVIVFDNANTVDVTAAKATLTGSGVIDMANAVLITGLSAADVLDNESNTIEGTGQLGGESLTVINRGTIDANLVNDLTLNATLITNTGLIEATNAGGTLIVFGPINNSGGVIDAKGGDIALEAGATISGGVLSQAGAGQFFIAGDAKLDGTAQAVTNNAVVSIQDALQLTLAGVINNAGVISIAGSVDDTDLVIDGPTVTLTGSGTVLMSNDANNRIFGDATTFTNVLDNVDNTIEGSGQIGAGKLILVNSGTVDANGAGASLLINATSATNTGLMESTGAGGLVIVTTVNNSGGRISANQGDVFLEDGADIVGGAMASSPLSHIFVANTGTAAVTLNGASSPLTNTGDIFVTDASQLDLIGAIANDGVISLNGTADNTDLVVNGTSATLTGGGTLELSDSTNNRIYGASAADKLINVNDTIEGSGQLGVGKLTLVNQGTIDATGVGASLVLSATSTVNTGLIESTNAGGLVIEGVVRNSGGVIAANAGNVGLEAGAVVSGGLLSAAALGEFFVTAGASLNGIASPLTNSATVFVEDGVQLSLAGSIVNDGVISLNSNPDITTLLAPSANVTLTGSGTIELSDGGGNKITGAVSTDVFDNETNTIEGSGEIGGAQLTVINRGTINATGIAEALRIDATSVTNTGLMESTNTGGLLIEDTIKNAGGVIAANNGAVFLNVATISGGLLSSTVGGVLFDQGVVSFDGTASQLTNRGDVFVEDGVQLFLAGAIANSGTMSLNASADNTDLIVNATSVALTGTGTILLSDSAENRIFGATSTDILDNEANTIEGAGQIGVGQLTLINRGTIDASGATLALVIDTTSASNSGLMEATTAPGLIIESVIKNAGGVIGAFGGDVFVEHGAAISGGTFSGQGGGNDEIEVLSGGSVLGASVGDGAVENVSSGARQSGVSVLSGGTELVLSGATTSATALKSGGVELMSSGGATSGGTVSAGGLLQGPGVLRGVVVDKGVVSGAAIANGGVLDVSSGGQALQIGVTSGGQQVVFSGGLDSGTKLGSGGTEFVSSGGISISGTVGHGGHATVVADGLASGMHVLSGGLLSILSGGVARNLAVDASGQVIDNGQVVIFGARIVGGNLGGTGVITETGPGTLVLSGAGPSFAGKAVISGGRIELSGAHAIGTGSVVFAAGAGSETLQIDAGDAPAPGGFFSNTISNFSGANDFMDMRSIAFVSGASAVVSGSTLTLSDGGTTYRFTLAGSIGSSLTVTGDGHGGTLIDPHVAGFAQAAAALSPSKAAALSSISRGGTSGFTALVTPTGSAGSRA